MEEEFKFENKGTMTLSSRESHPAWPEFSSFARKIGCSFAGTDWVVPWTYFMAGWELKEREEVLSGRNKK
jgi:hypothetical protein